MEQRVYNPAAAVGVDQVRELTQLEERAAVEKYK
jgi:hypothetical protein